MRRSAKAAVAAPVLVALLLTAPFLQRAPLWADEVDSVDAATRPWAALTHLLAHQDAPLGLYYGGLHLWLSVFGTSEAAVRAPSVVGAAVAAGLVAAVGLHLAGRAAGLLSGLLLATNPFVSSYGLDARPYALELACGAALALLVTTAPEQPGRRRRALYAALLAVGTGLHLFLLLAVPAHLIGLRAARRPLRPWLLPTAVALTVTTPLLLLASMQTAEVGYLHKPGLLSPLGWLQSMAGGTPWVAVPILVAAVLAVRSSQREQALAWGLLLLPGAVLMAVSIVHPLFLNRYVLPSTVGLAVVLGTAAARSGGKLRLLVTGVVAVAVAGTVVQQIAPYRYEDLRRGADLVLDASRPVDAIVFAPATVRAAASYYLSRIDSRSTAPHDVSKDLTADERVAGDFGGPEAAATPTVRALAARIRIWRMSWDDSSARRTSTDRSVLRLLDQSYTRVSRTRLGHLVVEEFVRTRPGPVWCRGGGAAALRDR